MPERWDELDETRRPTGRLLRRGEPIPPGSFHTVVHVWLFDGARFLLTKRVPQKPYGGLWECTGGSALAGEDAVQAAAREVAEETGLQLDGGAEVFRFTRQYEDSFLDVFLFHQAIALNEVCLQEGETCGAQLVDRAALLALHAAGKLLPYDYLDVFFAKFDKAFHS